MPIKEDGQFVGNEKFLSTWKRQDEVRTAILFISTSFPGSLGCGLQEIRWRLYEVPLEAAVWNVSVFSYGGHSRQRSQLYMQKATPCSK